MAKGLRSKTRKYWASERRRLYGDPVAEKQILEQTQKLKESIEKQTAQASILGLKSVLNPSGSSSKAAPVVKQVEMDVMQDAPEPPKQEAKPVAMEVVKEKDNKPVKKGPRAKYGRRGKGKGGQPLPPKEMVYFK